MNKICLKKGGFTLIEMLIAMSIFVIFVGVLVSSYSSIVRSQRDANNYRLLYSEARRVFDKITEEVRAGAIDYSGLEGLSYNSANSELDLISNDGKRSSTFERKDGLDEGSFATIVFSEDGIESDGGLMPLNSYNLTSEKINVAKFYVFVSPSADPYDAENVYADSLQFQPKVTVFARFEMDQMNGNEDPYFVELQTTISSRFYTVSPKSIDLP